MGFSTRFSETRLEQEGNCVRLRGRASEILLELRGVELDAAIRAGFVDRDNLHFSMFEYARMRATVPTLVPVRVRRCGTGANAADYDRGFLADLKICWE